MSHDNVATVRRLFDLLGRGDFDQLDAETPPDFKLDRSQSRSLENRVYRGPSELRAVWEDRADAWGELDFYETEMIDAGDTIIRVGGAHGRGKRSGVEVDAKSATLWRFREGKPVSATLFQSKAEALEAAGLSE
jgi:ketosteroid isomerase-like protein